MGAVVLVAIISALVLVLLLRRKRRPKKQYQSSGSFSPSTIPTHPTHVPVAEKPRGPTEKEELVTVTTPYRYHRHFSAGDETIPQQADDASVASRFSTLYDQIELHIENFYQDASPLIPPEVEGALSRYDTPLLSSPLTARLEESPRVRTILKHVLSYEICTTTISPTSGRYQRSLLPPQLLAAVIDVDQAQINKHNASSPTHQGIYIYLHALTFLHVVT